MNLQLVFGNPRKKTNKKAKRKAKSKKGASMAKARKPSKKKATKKATAKKAAKKVTKKATKKKAAKKVVAKKKTAKKAAKKKTAKKVAKKATKKKAAPKKAAKKAAKKTVKKAGKKKAAKKKAAPKKAAPKKAASKKRKTAKKATAKKAASKKRKSKSKTKSRRKPAKIQRVNRKTRTEQIRGMRKGQTRRYAWVAKGAKKGNMQRNRLGGPGRRYAVRKTVTRKNPIFGGKMSKVQKFMKHDFKEMSGLALGGFMTEGVNDLVSTKLPQVNEMLGKAFGRFSGAISPLALGLISGVVAEKSKNRKIKENLDVLAKGLIGSSVVGLGNTAYSMMFAKESAPVEGFVYDRIPSHDTHAEFGGFVTGDEHSAVDYSDYNAEMGSFEDSDFGGYYDEDAGY